MHIKDFDKTTFDFTHPYSKEISTFRKNKIKPTISTKELKILLTEKLKNNLTALHFICSYPFRGEYFYTRDGYRYWIENFHLILEKLKSPEFTAEDITRYFTTQDDFGRTPLHLAVVFLPRYKFMQLISHVKQHGVQDKDFLLYTTKLSVNNNEDILSSANTKKENIEEESELKDIPPGTSQQQKPLVENDGQMIFHVLAKNKKSETVFELLKEFDKTRKELILKYQDNVGNTVLHELFLHLAFGNVQGNKDILSKNFRNLIKEWTLKELIELVTIPNNQGITPLHIIAKKHKELFFFVVKKISTGRKKSNQNNIDLISLDCIFEKFKTATNPPPPSVFHYFFKDTQVSKGANLSDLKKLKNLFPAEQQTEKVFAKEIELAFCLKHFSQHDFLSKDGETRAYMLSAVSAYSLRSFVYDENTLLQRKPFLFYVLHHVKTDLFLEVINKLALNNGIPTFNQHILLYADIDVPEEYSHNRDKFPRQYRSFFLDLQEKQRPTTWVRTFCEKLEPDTINRLFENRVACKNNYDREQLEKISKQSPRDQNPLKNKSSAYAPAPADYSDANHLFLELVKQHVALFNNETSNPWVATKQFNELLETMSAATKEKKEVFEEYKNFLTYRANYAKNNLGACPFADAGLCAEILENKKREVKAVNDKTQSILGNFAFLENGDKKKFDKEKSHIISVPPPTIGGIN